MASSCTYYFIVAKKGKKYSINIQFEMEQFIHLTGIPDHLSDLPFARNNPGDLRKAIEEGKLTMKDLAKSQNFDRLLRSSRPSIETNSRLAYSRGSRRRIMLSVSHAKIQEGDLQGSFVRSLYMPFNFSI
jgi:hypothetical protein